MGQNDVKIDIHNNLLDLESEWCGLQAAGLCTFYQTFEWCKAWHETAGKSRGVEPLIVVGRHAENNQVIFILPFALEKSIGSRTLCWYSSAEITYGFGIFDRKAIASNPKLIEQLWPDILEKIGAVDILKLENQPENWDGIENPLKFLFTQTGANQSYLLILAQEFETLYNDKRSSSSRRSARKRDKKLAAAGELSFGLPKTSEATGKVIDIMVDQQRKRLGTRGIKTVYDETRLAFLHQLAKATFRDGTPVLLPYNLSLDGEICSVMLGGSFQSTYWAMVSSLTNNKELHPFSPGDHALRATIESLCTEKYSLFDFSAGTADYKTQWSDKSIVLYESVRAATLKGLIGATFGTTATKLKRQIKQSPWLFSLAKSARKLFSKT